MLDVAAIQQTEFSARRARSERAVPREVRVEFTLRSLSK
jgi:hypothetical protein